MRARSGRPRLRPYQARLGAGTVRWPLHKEGQEERPVRNLEPQHHPSQAPQCPAHRADGLQLPERRRPPLMHEPQVRPQPGQEDEPAERQAPFQVQPSGQGPRDRVPRQGPGPLAVDLAEQA